MNYFVFKVGVVVEMLFSSMLFALKGRRWGGRIKITFNAVKGVSYQGSIYDAEPTFTSYGVAHGDRAGTTSHNHLLG
jgi:hypothetical protein